MNSSPQADGAPHAAAEETDASSKVGASREMADGMQQVAAAGLEGGVLSQPPLAFAAAAVVEPEKSQPEAVAGLCQSDLLRRIPVAQQPVAADDDGRGGYFGKMQRPPQVEAIGREVHLHFHRCRRPAFSPTLNSVEVDAVVH